MAEETPFLAGQALARCLARPRTSDGQQMVNKVQAAALQSQDAVQAMRPMPHVNSGTTKVSRFERSCQCKLVDQSSPGHIDEVRSTLHRRKLLQNKYATMLS